MKKFETDIVEGKPVMLYLTNAPKYSLNIITTYSLFL